MMRFTADFAPLFRTVGVVLCLAVITTVAACTDESASHQVATIDSVDAEEPSNAGNEATGPQADEVDRYLELRQDLAECFRNNGLPDTEDPDELGDFTIQIGSPGASKALTACKEIGEATRDVPRVIQEQIEERRIAAITPAEKQFEIDLADCMQENGVPEFPDPLSTGDRGTMPWDEQGGTGSAPAEVQEVLALCNRKLGNGPP